MCKREKNIRGIRKSLDEFENFRVSCLIKVAKTD